MKTQNKIMKKFLGIAILATAFTACNNANEPEVTATTPITATFTACINKAVTRASGTMWAQDDAIGVTGGGYANIKYLCNADGAAQKFTVATPANAIYYQDAASVNFTGYYPFSGAEKTAAGVINKTITSADQGASQSQIDYLFGTGVGSKSNPDVNFTFNHQMSRVVLVFLPGEDVSLTDLTAYELGHLIMEGTFDTATGAAAATAASAPTSLSMTVTGAAAPSYTSSLILFPQQVASLTLTVTLGGQPYTATLDMPVMADTQQGLESGKSCIYNVTVNKTSLNVSKATITDWEEITKDVNARM